MKLKTDNIFQVIEIKSTPEKVYDALMNEKSLAEFTGMTAKIENKIFLCKLIRILFFYLKN